jgi:4-amino-4-deoxy-L-arabinose transferase-like glycosyltransferase
METRIKYILILFAMGTFIFLFNLGGRDLWEPDETRYAVIAREMAESGNWILVHLNGQIYAEKPPLFFWLVNLSTFFFGVNNEFTNRIPSALAGLITLLITFLFGERLFNLRTGFLSSLALATCFLFPQLSRWMMLDSLFTLFFLLALFYFYLGYEEEKRRRRYYYLAGLFMGLGVLTKGPVTYLAIPIFLIFAFFQKNLKKFWCRHLLWGCLLSVILVLIWWVPACWIGGKDYIHWILFKQAVGTYVEGGIHFHPQPFYFYFIRFPLEFFPWIVFLPTAFIFGLQKEGDKRKEFLFLFVWFVFIFLFFTFSIGKKDNYLLPLYPAAAMMVGRLWDSGIQSSEGRRGFIPGLILLAFLFLAGSILFLSGVPQKSFPTLMPYQSLGLSILIYLLIGSLVSLIFLMKKKQWVSFISLVITFGTLHLHISYSLPPRLNAQRSMKTFSERILKRMEVGDDLKTYLFKSNGLFYYTRRPYIEEIESQDRLFEVLHSSQRVYIVIFAEGLDQLRKDSKIEINPIERTRVGHWNYVLISNR